MTEVDTIITRFETDASRAVSELMRLKTAQDVARSSAEEQSAAFRKSHDATKTLGDRMREFARGQRQEGAAARYYVNEFASFLPVGSQMHGMLQSLTAGLIGGGGFGLALEAVTFGLQLMGSEFTKANEEIAKMEAATAKIVEGAQGRSASLLEQLAELRGGAMGLLAFRQQMERDTLAGEMRKAQRARAQASFLTQTEWDLEILKIRDQIKALDRLQQDEQGKFLQVQSARKKQKDKEKADAKAEASRKAEQELRQKYADWERDWYAERWQAGDKFYKEMVKGAKLATSETLEELKKSTIAFAGGGAYDPTAAAEDARYAQMIQNWADEIRAADDAIIESNREAKESFRDLGRNGIGAFASSVGQSLGSVVRHSRAYEAAMKAAGGATVITADLSGAAFARMTQDALAAIAEESAVKAIVQTAEGFASAATGNEAAAGAHFASAAKFAAAAALAGVSAYAIGETRGMTADERASVDAYRDRSRDTGSDYGSSTDAAGGGRTVVINNYWTGQALVTPAEVQKYLADQYREAEVKGWLDPSSHNRERVIANRRALLRIR